MRKIFIILYLGLTSCANNSLSVNDSASKTAERNVAHDSRMVAGDRFIIKFIDTVKIPHDLLRVNLGYPKTPYDAYLEMKSTSRTDRAIPGSFLHKNAFVEGWFSLRADPACATCINNLVPEDSTSEIARLILYGGGTLRTGRSFKSFAEMKEYLKDHVGGVIEISDTEPQLLDKVIFVH